MEIAQGTKIPEDPRIPPLPPPSAWWTLDPEDPRHLVMGTGAAMPVSMQGKNWLGGRASQFDSLSTLLMLSLEDEYQAARANAALMGSALPVHTFEYHIRIVGGLLGAY